MQPLWSLFAAGLVVIVAGLVIIRFRRPLAKLMDETHRALTGRWRERIWGDARITPAAVGLSGCGCILWGLFAALVALFAPEAL